MRRGRWKQAGSLFRAMLVLGGMLLLTLLSAWLTLILLTRGHEVSVPDVVGLETQEAIRILQKEGLNLRVQEGKAQFSEEIPAGRVLRQQPEAGSQLKQNRKVKVVLSLGSERLGMPDLLGSSIRQARIVLNQNGLQMGEITRAFSSGVPASRIIAQDPPAGQDVRRDTAVNILLSRGREGRSFVMPDLIGRNLDRVRPWMETRGLRLGQLNYAGYPGLEQGTIISQTPLAGYPLPGGRAIELTVNR